MNRYNEISTLQYMGSKTRIISHICEPIIKNKSLEIADTDANVGVRKSIMIILMKLCVFR